MTAGPWEEMGGKAEPRPGRAGDGTGGKTLRNHENGDCKD